MTTQTERLLLLQSQCARKAHLEAVLQELTQQKPALEKKTAALKAAMLKKQRVIDKLERGGLAGMIYNLMGNREARIEKRKQEAKKIFLDYSSATRDLKTLEGNVRRFTAELKSLQDCPAEYDALLYDIVEQLNASESRIGMMALEHRQNETRIASQIKELNEAISVGNAALSTTQTILFYLHQAEDLGSFDLLGGGLFTDIAKHEALDAAQRGVDTLQTQLRSFRSELADVAMDAGMKVTIDGFLGFADFFFDGLLADWVVLDEIKSAIQRVTKTAEEISNVIAMLEARKADAHSRLAIERRTLESLILQD